MPVLVKLFLPEDVGKVVVLEQQCGLEVWREQDYVNMLTGDASFHGLVAAAEQESAHRGGPSLRSAPLKRLVGFIAGRIFPPDAEIYKLAVNAEFRRQGIGSQLMRHFISMAAARGVFDCFLEVRRSNVGAIQFYHWHGFVVHRMRPHYYANPVEDALIMLRRGDRRQ